MDKDNKRQKYVKAYKFNSLFMKTFFSLTIFSFLAFLLFGIFVAKISSKNLVEANISAHTEYVKQSANSVDLTLDNLSDIMNATFFNKNVIPLVIAPKDQPHEKRVFLTRQLSDVVDSNKIIKDATVYVKLTDEVYTSKGEITSLENYSGRQVIIDYIKEPFENLLSTDKKYSTDLRIFKNRLYMIQEFPPSLNACVGLLVFELNAKELFNMAFNFTEGEKSNVCVYNKNGFQIFDNLTSGEIGQYISAKILYTHGSFTYKSNEQGAITAFYSKSHISDWYFIYPVSSMVFAPVFTSALGGLVPFAVVFFVFCIMISLYIASIVYKPISALMRNISPNQNHDKLSFAKNEIDFFNLAYNDIKSRQSFYDEMLENIAPSVLERIVRLCLKGEVDSTDKISAKLLSIPTKFKEHDRYTVVVVEILEIETNSESAVDEDVCIMDTIHYINHLLNGKADYIITRMSDNQLVVVFRFQPDSSIIKIKSYLVGFKEEMLGRVENKNHYTLDVGIGRVYNHILDIQYSYGNAQENLSSAYNIVNDISCDEVHGDIYYTYEYFISRIVHIEENIDSLNYARALELTSRMIGELTANVSDISQVKKSCIALVERLILKLTVYKVSMNDPLISSIPPIDLELSYCTTIEDVGVFIVSYSNEIILLFESYNSKVKHKYIIRAKEYINTNYTDSGLSQQIVADYVGIHSSYLSRLFKDNLGTNFVDFLNEYRVEKAKQLLINTDIAVKDIATETGFQSMSTFFRVFKKFDDMSPGQYREKHKK